MVPVMGISSATKDRVQKQVDESIGTRFGQLVVLRRSPSSGRTKVDVKCDCGYERSVRIAHLLCGSVTSCGTKQHRDAEIVDRYSDIVGRRFGLLTVESMSPVTIRRRAAAWVRCECGATRCVSVSDLLGSTTVTCGGDAHKTTVKPQAKRWEVHGKRMTYALEAVGTGMVKIGAARDLHERIKKIQHTSPVDLRVFATSGDDIERTMHAELEQYRSHGEWFTANENVLALIAQRMQPASISFIETARHRAGRQPGRKHACKACGTLGHYAKTCPQRRL